VHITVGCWARKESTKMFGGSSFDTNPSLEEGEEFGHHDSLHPRFRASATGGNGRNSTNWSRSQSTPQVDEELTAVSTTSHQSDVEPSFFIIPPLDTRMVRQQRILPWERVPCAKSGTMERSSNEAVAASILTEAPSGTYSNVLGGYRRDHLVRAIDGAGESGMDGHAAILKSLKRAGILIFIVDSKVSRSVADVMDSVHNVITHIRKLQRETPHMQEFYEVNVDDVCIPRAVYDVSSKNEWCLLYRDPDGRLFNLTLAPHTAVLAETWESLLQSFSVLQAVSILVVLARSFSCFTSGTYFPLN
jgi:hypothetical protein